MKLKKRIAALLMAGAMVCSTLPVNALAVENSNQNVVGLCEHHTEHNADCGYTEGIEGTPCGYICEICGAKDELETATPSKYTISEGAVTIDDSCGNKCSGHTITGSSNTNTITVTGGNHHIILNDVNIDVSGTYEAGALDLDTAGICTITLQGSNVLKSGGQRPGIRVPANNKVTINGDGSLEVRGGQYWPGIGRKGNGNIEIQSGTIHAYGGQNAAGIGGSWGSDGGIITINGGNVTANGQYGAGIGGGANGSGGTITISGGNVTANGSSHSAGIGYGYNGSGSNSFTTGTSGGALIFANGGISDKTSQDSWKGIIFDGNTGKVYGDQTLQENLEIPSDKTLTVPKNTTLTVNRGVTLTNNGRITGYGTLDGEGNLVGSGTVADTIQNNLQKDSAVAVMVSPSMATYGSNVSITATISKAANAITRAAENQVEFFVGTDSNKKSLGTANVNDDTATLSNVEISQEKGFAVGENIITAEYGGSMGLKPQTGSSTLAVTAAKLSAPQNLTWGSDTPGKATARWDAVTNASGYSVSLYKDGRLHDSSDSVTGTSQTFTITEAGSYTVKVKAKGTGNYADSNEAESSGLTFYAVTFETNGGSTIAPQIVVSGGKATTPTAPTKTDHTFDGWYSDSNLTTPYDFNSGTITAATTIYAKWEANGYQEQFSLTPGSTYWFDLSGTGIPGTKNDNLPDGSLHWVPFTYVGTVDAYKLESAQATTEDYARENAYDHSLFIADYNVTRSVSWDELNDKKMIFGTTYTSYGVDYTMRAPSAGSNKTGEVDSAQGTPRSNEWDAILDKDSGYIKNWSDIYSWGQDNAPEVSTGALHAVRGCISARIWFYYFAMYSRPFVGFRPVLEILNAGTLNSDGLKVVTLDLGGGTLGNSSEDIQIIVKTGSEFTAPASDGMTRPDGDTGKYFMWLDANGNSYEPGGSVPADVTKLTVQWTAPTYTVTLNTNGGTINSGDVTSYTYGVGATLPTADNMTYTGHAFKGWYDNEGLTGSPVTAIGDTETGNKEYWAKWEANTYTVTLNANGGTIADGKDVTSYTYGIGATLPTVNDMTYAGHTFKGWYDNEGLTGSPVTAISDTETGNKEYWAKWEANAYTVTLNANGGTINSGNVTSYTYGVGATLPTAGDMTYTGHTFKGWYEDSNFSGSPVMEISTTATGAKTYYAKWLSTDAGITAVSVDNTAGTINGTTITVVLPYGTVALPTENSKVSITAADGATVSGLTTTDGSEWTFAVTAADGQTTAGYTISVSIAPDPATGNRILQRQSPPLKTTTGRCHRPPRIPKKL